MNRRLFGALGAIAVLTWTGACAEDPLSDLDGNPAAVITNFTNLQLAIGSNATVRASVVDARATPLAVPITFEACTGDVTVVEDPDYHPVPATSAQAIVTAVTANPSCVRIRGGGVVDSISVAVLPQGIAAAISNATPQGGDTITIGSTAVLKFDPATVTVTFGGGAEATILSATPDLLTVLVPFSDAGPLTIGGIDVTYVPGLTVSLPTTTAVTQTGDLWAGDDDFATAPTIAIPADGETIEITTTFGAGDNSAQCAETAPNFDFGSTGPCVIYRFDVAATTTLTFSTDWDSGADLDIYACGDADPSPAGGCFEDGGGGATGAQPQAFSFDFPAGTHYFVVENYDGTATRNIKITITQP